MKRLIPVCLFLIQVSLAQGQASNTWSVKFSNAILSRYTPTINAMTAKGWEYSNTIILHGIEKVYNQVNTASYLNYIKAFIDTYLNADGSFKATVTLTSLDRIHPGISVLFLYEKLKSNPADSAKYRTAATNLRNVLVGGAERARMQLVALDLGRAAVVAADDRAERVATGEVGARVVLRDAGLVAFRLLREGQDLAIRLAAALDDVVAGAGVRGARAAVVQTLRRDLAQLHALIAGAVLNAARAEALRRTGDVPLLGGGRPVGEVRALL